jgi:hypothetical protein
VKEKKRRRFTVEIPEEEAQTLENWLSLTDEDSGTHGTLDLGKLAAMLLEDVALVQTRLGCWEASKMYSLLESHGYSEAL